jgi:beta-glucosidase
MSKKFLQFPKGFYWGAATSSHQVEGGNYNDWTEWEKKNAKILAAEAEMNFLDVAPDWERIKPEATDPQNYISGQAADHYNRFSEDIKIMKELNFTAYRFSIEWSRVEPAKQQFNNSAIEHYRNVIDELKRNGIEPFVTLWHRSNPMWVAEQGGWENKETVRNYLNYVLRIVKEFGPDVKFWMPLNEPIFFILGSYLGGQYPPQVKSLLRSEKVFKNLITAFNEASQIIHEHINDVQVGTADAAMYLEAFENKWHNKLTVRLINWYCNDRFTKATLPYADFLGVQYYTRGLVNWEWKKWYPKPVQVIEPAELHPSRNRSAVDDIRDPDLNAFTLMKTQMSLDPGSEAGVDTKYPLSDMGWEIYPKGLYNFLMDIKKYNKPVIITENGIADALDVHREQFIKNHLTMIHHAISSGVNVKGYLHWSLLDNLEWNKGFWPKFGLVDVDSKTMQRKIRKSALTYAEIIKNNGL